MARPYQFESNINYYNDCTQVEQIYQKGNATISSAHRFPPSNFTYSLTLFSEFFSFFPHGTSFLSVFTSYLALGELYLPITGAISSTPTLKTQETLANTSRLTYGTITLYGASFRKN